MDQRTLTPIDFSLATLITTCVDEEGSAGHDYSASAARGEPKSFARNLVDFADFVHLLTILHGEAPGLIDHAAARTVEVSARAWLLTSIDGFAVERDYLHRLCVAVGPVPSTPRQSEASTVIAQQRHAIEMLSQSERRGCALGTAVALVLEWQVIRKIMDVGAIRLGIEPPELVLPTREETGAVLDALPQPDRLSRAIEFGVAQLLVQHRGMWDLLKARTAARQAQR